MSTRAVNHPNDPVPGSSGASAKQPKLYRVPRAGFDVEEVCCDFPILASKVHGRPLVYLDNAATSQKPQVVIDAVCRFYEQENANIHRGVHFLSERATESYELARRTVQHFVNARHAHEIIFVRGATEAINLVTQSYGRGHIRSGDEIVLTTMEHHSNIVPWQMLCEERGARLRVAPISDSGELLWDEFQKLLSSRTKMVAVTQVSNALGTVNPVQRIIAAAHSGNIPVLVDGAQAVPHFAVDVQALGCDFYAFSGHKIYGPTGIGILYGKSALLDAMPPFQGGGDMIASVSFEKTLYNKLPHKFEAGTPNVAGAIGLGAGIKYLNGLGMANVAAHERQLLEYATSAISLIPGIRLIGTARERAGVLSFVMDGIHPHDIGTILDQEGVAIRTGHHCAQPLMQRFGVPATARASFALYNTRKEVDALVEGLKKVREVFFLMVDLRELYQQVILEHSKAPRNYRQLDTANHKAEGYNPLCGDHFTIYLHVEGDCIREISFQGSGCAISKASASMMTQSVKGKTRAEAETIFQQFHELVTGRANGNHLEVGKLAVFSGVANFPVRVKCATLPWHALQAALESDQEAVATTE